MSSAIDDDEEEGGGAGWIVSYADLMTLLFAAFVVLYGITPQGKSMEILGIASSIREAFIEIPDEVPEVMRKAEMFQGKLSFVEATRDSTINPVIKKFNRRQNILPERTKELQELELQLKEMSQGEGLESSLRKATQFAEDEFGFQLRLIDKAFFPPGKATMTSEGKNFIRRLSKKLLSAKEDIFLEGHADQRQPQSQNPMELSAKRAEYVKNLMIQYGVNKDRIFLASYGELRPLGKNGSPKNNRVEIKFRFFKRTR